VAAAPLYLKGNSAGEFVYDYVWADVANQLGIDYYPKLVGVCPATPMMGYRFLMDPREDEDWLIRRMVEAIDKFCLANKISGCSFLFVDPDWHEKAESLRFLPWRHQSYIWENPGYANFDDYLGSFNKNQRRNIRRERSKMAEQGIIIKTLTGDSIPPDYFDLMYDFYEMTNRQFGPWAAKYLNREFFTGLYPDFRHRLLLVAAYREGKSRERGGETPVGMSMLLTKGDRLLGRYWGASEWIDSLHFNVCYYSPIEWAIHQGIKQFDPGAGSPHKIRRGFRAVPNFSLHRFYDQRMNQVMSVNIDRINQMEQQHIDELNERLPFREKP
jgi:predicted N-acyltransferase